MSKSIPDGATHYVTRRGYIRYYKCVEGKYYYYGLSEKWVISALRQDTGPDYLKTHCTELSLETIMDSFLKSEGKS